jgi:hypothetical protein
MNCGIHVRFLLLALVFGGCDLSCNRLKKEPGAESKIAPKSTIHIYEKDGTERDAVYEFATGFYDWYVAASSDKGYSELLDRKEMRIAVAPELLRALKEDSEAGKQTSSEEIGGLEFDPFIDTEEAPCDRYIVGKINPNGEDYWADIHGITDNSYNMKPDFIAEIKKSNGSWIISNFHYPGQPATDLRNLLAGFQRERLKAKSNP